MGVKVLLVDDHAIVRQGLKSLIAKESDLEVIAEAEDGLTAIEIYEQTNPDIVIMDISMPNLNGIEATRRIRSIDSKAKVITLSVHNTRRFVTEAIKAGSSGYISKECLFKELIEAISSVRENRNYISPSIASVLINDYIEQSSQDVESGISKLNSRERQVLQMLAEGKNTKEIAKILELSGKTIDAIRRHIMDKLDLHSLAELTKYAVNEGLTTLEF